MVDWLYVSVSIERAIATIQDINLNKAKANRVAKWVVIGVCLFLSIIVTSFNSMEILLFI
jgi:hypothetical protein